MRRLPPLNALRAFEAAARHSSFNQGADELHVTPSAISHQIKGLEEFFDVRLFRRVKRRVVLTNEGRDFLAPITNAFDQIDAAAQRLMRRPQGTLLNISVSPTFATGWLVPRISEFQSEHPEIEIRMSTQVRFNSFEDTSVDVAITYGHGDWEALRRDCVVEWLMEEHLLPVCSPRLTGPNGPLKSLDDIRKVTLIHALPRIGQWENWLRAAGLRDIDAARGPKFQTTPLALEAAIAGSGVAIGNPELVARHIENGELVVPFEIEMPSDAGYHLLYPKSHAEDQKIVTFRRWLIDRLAEDHHQVASPLAVA